MDTITVVDGHFHVTPPERWTPLETVRDVHAFTGAIDVLDPARADGLLAGVIGARAVRIAFASSHDGRGNSLAAGLRARGYAGRLVAFGQVLAEQYPLALRCGFDAVEVPADLAARQPEPLWCAAGRRREGYLERLSGRARAANPVREAA